MERRKFVIGLGSLAAGGAAATGTGALSVTSEGTAQIDVSDGAALAEVDPNTSSDYVADTDPITIDVSDGGNGVPEMSNIVVQPAFTIGNNSSEKLYAEVLNPYANTNITDSSGTSGGAAGVGTDAKKGLDVQFLATTAGTDISNSPNRNVALIDRDELPNGDPLGGEFNKPGSNAQFFLQGSGFTLSNRTSLQNSSKTQAGYLEIDSGQAFDVVYQLVTRSPGDTSLSAGFTINVVDDPADLNLSNAVDDHIESGGT